MAVRFKTRNPNLMKVLALKSNDGYYKDILGNESRDWLIYYISFLKN